MFDDSLLLSNAVKYSESRGIELRLEAKLGHGTDGSVWETSSHSAVKALDEERVYQTELTCYQRLREAGVSRIGRFAVPELEDSDDGLQVIEMSIVQPPFLLDFGKVYLDREPPYWDDPDAKATIYESWQADFGDRWPDVAAALGRLERLGIWYVDPKPANIDFGG